MLVRIGDEEISLSHFLEVYRRNNLETVIQDPKTVEEYLEMYIDYRLKVMEAKLRGMDTTHAFISELDKYRDQLAERYLVDSEVTGQLLREAYERSRYDIRASHILLTLDEHAMPEDTLRVYRRMLEIRERIVSGESFADVAREASEEPSARDQEGDGNRPVRPGNAGDLGYFTVLNMIYPFETAAYSTPVGQISLPVRTRFGYHLIKVNNRLPAMGSARVAHIMLMTPSGMDAEDIRAREETIHQIYEQLQQGGDFGELVARYSEDRQSAQRQGEMPAFTSNRMVPEFIEAISRLDTPNAISPPVRTNFGWHIIRLIEKNPPPAFEMAAPDLTNRIQRDARSQKGQQVVIDRLKKEYAFSENREALAEVIDHVDESIFLGQWETEGTAHLNEELFRFSQVVVTQQQLIRYLDENQIARNPEEVAVFVNKNYERFVRKQILDYEKKQLHSKYPEFRNTIREYHDGILLFEITDKLVWQKAVADSSGQRSFFEANAENYFWGERLEAVILGCADQEMALRALEFLQGETLEEHDREGLAGAVSREFSGQMSLSSGLYEKGGHPALEGLSWEAGVHGPAAVANQYFVVGALRVLPGQPKRLSEVRGSVIADYQQHLEKEWVKQLRAAYPVWINQEALKQLNAE